MLKKIAFLVILLFPIQHTFAFSDVSEGNIYYVPLTYLQEHNFITGYSDNTFKPFQDINRAESLALLNKAIPYHTYSTVEKPRMSTKNTVSSQNNLDLPPETNECQFSDVEKNSWFSDFICTAFNNKVVQGYPDGKFYPEKNINKVEALKMALLQSAIPLPTTTGDNFNDVSQQDWFSKYTQLAKIQSYYVENREGNLKPNETLNRGDFALLIYRIIKNRTENSFFGKASYYNTSLEGSNTSSGDPYKGNELTAAHKTLALGTKVKVTNLANGKTVTVIINDRGPYTKSFVLDLSTKAFTNIANLSTGVINIEYQVIP